MRSASGAEAVPGGWRQKAYRPYSVSGRGSLKAFEESQ